MKKVLITGGAGFVGSNLAILMKQHDPEVEVYCLDNLSRRGSELNLSRLQSNGIKFLHGDVRNKEDIYKIGNVDWLIECSAEPSVHAGFGENPTYLLNTNLLGLIHCLEFLREKGGNLIFLSTSRVYPIKLLRDLPLKLEGKRFVLETDSTFPGIRAAGISEAFPLEGNRSLYGATKLCAELLIQEYCHMYGLKAIINRCGVLAGAWQMGKVDQGFMALWVARHYFGGGIQYKGFGGDGFQVRDILHVRDLYSLLQKQMREVDTVEIFNVGGGIGNSISLSELTDLTRRITGKACEVGSEPATQKADIPYYVTDTTKVKDAFAWQPGTTIAAIVEEIVEWISSNALLLKPIFSL